MSSDHVALKEFIERILEERQRAVETGTKVIEGRLEALNHLRAEVERDRTLYATKSMVDQIVSDFNRRIIALETTQGRMIGVGMALVVFAGIMGALVSRLFK